jgi:hypothetical protein
VQNFVPDPSLAVSVVMATAVVMAAVASPFDEPQHLLRATEKSPDLADVHVRLAFSRHYLTNNHTKPRSKSSTTSPSYLAVVASDSE